MKADEVLLIICLVCIGAPLLVWYQQDSIYSVLQYVDLLILKAYSSVPYFGERYANIGQSYQQLSPEELRWQHVWIAGQIAWRPVMTVLFVPIMLRWAWKSWKVRRAQSFNNIDKSYILKHCRTKQTVENSDTRQQWVVRRWYQYYGLHRMPWGGVEWNLRLRSALALQLGKPSEHPESQELLREFATFIHGQVVKQFGKKLADKLPPNDLVEEATKGHAYCATAMVRVLAAARDTYGVVSPQGFRNRLFQDAETVPIWFGLNGVMRQTTHVESLGVLSHFYVEVAEGEALTEPQMDNAILGLEKYREHLIEQRKLKDLDESEAYDEQERREARKQQPQADLLGLGEEGYKEDEQAIV